MWRQGWWITRWEGTSSEAKRNELLTFWLVTRSCLAREGAQGRSFLFLRVFGFAHLPLHNAAALLSAVSVLLDAMAGPIWAGKALLRGLWKARALSEVL
jgi:hypothetical protein